MAWQIGFRWLVYKGRGGVFALLPHHTALYLARIPCLVHADPIFLFRAKTNGPYGTECAECSWKGKLSRRCIV